MDTRNEWIADFIAGWVSGAASILACQPIDTVLTRFQAAAVTPTMSSTSTISIMTGHNTTTINHWRTLTMDVCRVAGPKALWRGASPVIIAAPIQNSLLMGGYGLGSRYFSGPDIEISSLSRSKQIGAIFIGGCTGGELYIPYMYVDI